MNVGRFNSLHFQVIRWTMRLAASLGVSALVGGLAACVILPSPDDLAFVSIRRVPLDEVPDSDQHSFLSNELRPDSILEVSFASRSKNLIEYVREWESPRLTSTWCSQWADRDALHNEAGLMMTGGGVYWHNIDVLWKANSMEGLPSEWKSEQPFVYRVYIGTNRGPYYDLREHAEDVCIQLLSVGMSGAAGKTNSVIVPAAAIRAALDQ